MSSVCALFMKQNNISIDSDDDDLCYCNLQAYCFFVFFCFVIQAEEGKMSFGLCPNSLPIYYVYSAVLVNE